MYKRQILAFARYLAQKEVPVWVRHVVVPGLTDSEAGWKALGTLLASLPNVRAVSYTHLDVYKRQ